MSDREGEPGEGGGVAEVPASAGVWGDGGPTRAGVGVNVVFFDGAFAVVGEEATSGTLLCFLLHSSVV